MKKHYLLILFLACSISYGFYELIVASTLGVPTVEDIYGGRINAITGYQFHTDSTRIFVATESANSVFYADVYSNTGSPVLSKFKVIPSLDNTQDFGSNISKLVVHEAANSIYFSKNKELFYTSITASTATTTNVTGIDDFTIKGNYAFVAAQAPGQIEFGTLDASNNFTPGSGSPLTFTSFTNFSYMYIHPTSDKMYIFTAGTSPKLYVSNDDYDAFSGTTSFSDISPTLTSSSVDWTAFGIGPDGRFFLGGNNNTNKYIAYSDDSGSSWTEYDSGINGTSATNFDFSGNASSYHVLFASMFSNSKGTSGTWAKFGTTSHYTHPNDGAVYVDPVNASIYYATSDQGLGISYDQGVTVSSADDGIEAVQVNDMEMTVDKKTGWIASKSGIRKVTDYDTSSPTWTNAIWPNGDGSPYFSVAMKPSDDATAYVGNVRVYKTTDSGSTWSQVFTPESAPYNYPNVGTQVNALTICPADENIIFAGVEIQGSDKGGLFVSEDAGSSWTQIYLHASSGSNDVDVHDIVFTVEGGKNVAYVGVEYTGSGSGYSIYRVEQGSSSWTVTQDMGPSGTSTGSVIVVSINDLDYNASNNTIYATGTDAGTNHPVSYSKPLGGTGLWTVNTSSGFPTSNAQQTKVGKAIVHDGTNTLYCAVDHEIYYLTSGASSWTLGYSYPVGTEINCLFYDELLVGTGTGLYAQADPSTTASITDENILTISVYPNPAKSGNPITIQYEEPINNPTFRITDLSGRLVAEYQLHQIQSDANSSTIQIPQNITRGMYLLSIYNKKRKISTQKMLVN